MKGLLVALLVFSCVFFVAADDTAAADTAADEASAFSFFSCKCTSEDICWPSQYQWRAFNASIGGALLQPMPPSYQCHIPYYNAVGCNKTAAVYANRYWREDHPLALQQPHNELDVVDNKGCIGVDNKNSYCFRGNLPYYVTNATTIAQVQATVKFASKNNLRLVVKNTGHDFQGRSTAKNALSLWLHNMKKVEFSSSFVPEGCTDCSGHSAIILGPGVQLGPVLAAANARGLVLTGGSCPTVGLAGGWVQGGGHGLLGPSLGMGADTVLQYKVVTADGKLRIANKCQNRDLFWALRGGGGGTYGVVVETVMKTFSSPPIVGAVISFNANSTASFRLFVSKLVEVMPGWSDKGWAAYEYLYASSMTFVGLNPTSNLTYAQSTLAPFLNWVSATPGLSYTTVVFSVFPSFYPFFQIAAAPHDTTIYGNLVIGSWLLPRENYIGTTNIQAQTQALINVVNRNENGYIFIMMVAGGAVSTNAGCETSVNPAWRKALTHNVVTANIPFNVTKAQRTLVEASITSQAQEFRNLAPESGAYTNEADYNEPDWQRAFYGEYYDQLEEIKNLYDPNDLFICHKCVGSEGRSPNLNCKL